MVTAVARQSPERSSATPRRADSSSGSEPVPSTPAPESVRPHALAKLVRSDGTIDWSPWYLSEEEDMGQSGEQGQIIKILDSSLRVLLEERGLSSVLVATDNFFAWVPGQPLVQVSPDIYLVDHPARSGAADASKGEESQPPARSLASRMLREPLPSRWETWRPEHPPPRLAIEIVSQDWKKDYDINPDRYDHLGVRELVLVDPEAFRDDRSKAGRAPLVVFRRSSEGRLEQIYRGHGPALCAEIDAFLVFESSSTGPARVRISRDEAGMDLVADAWEDAAAARQETAAARQETATARAETATARAETATAREETAAARAETATARAETAAAKERATTAEQKAAALAAELAELRSRLHDAEQE